MTPLMRRLSASVLVSALSMLAASATAAQTIDVGIFGQSAANGSSIAGLAVIMTQVFRGVLGVVGFVCLCQAIWGGFLLATDGGLEDIDDEAKYHVKYGIIGLAVVAIAIPSTGYIVALLAKTVGGVIAFIV